MGRWKSTKPRPLEERFWEKVDRRGPDDCWEWQAATREGYGVLGEGPGSRRALKAHRVSWTLHHGKIPDAPGHHGGCVLHKCDNRLCVNPRHLYVGTQKQNMHDRFKRHPDGCPLSRENRKRWKSR